MSWCERVVKRYSTYVATKPKVQDESDRRSPLCASGPLVTNSFETYSNVTGREFLNSYEENSEIEHIYLQERERLRERERERD